MHFNVHLAQFLCDHSDGFFRRQIILTTKDKPKDCVSNLFLTDKPGDEIVGILLWAIEGLHHQRQSKGKSDRCH